MPCSICRQAGHNRSTCPMRTRDVTSVPTPPVTSPRQVSEFERSVLQEPLMPVRDYRVLWKTAIRRHLHLNRFEKCAAIRLNILINQSLDMSMMMLLTRIVYFPWLKIKDIIPLNASGLPELERLRSKHSAIISLCNGLHSTLNPIPTAVTDMRKIDIVSMKHVNYLIYWVLGNYLIQDIDEQENPVKYIGMITKMGKYGLTTMDGHRFYIIPHRFDIEPLYHPRTDKQFTVEPYCQINIHDKLSKTIYIDNKDELSELNRWKFNALKLDFLIKQVIMLGGKNNDVLESVLDLHQDISLDSVSEIEKDYAGIPSQYTNIT